MEEEKEKLAAIMVPLKKYEAMRDCLNACKEYLDNQSTLTPDEEALNGEIESALGEQ